MTLAMLATHDLEWLRRKMPIDQMEDAANSRQIPWGAYSDLRTTYDQIGREIWFRNA